MLPEGWKIQELCEFATLESRKFDPRTQTEPATCIELEHISQGTGKITGFVSTISNQSVKNVFSAGQVLFGKLRPYLRKFAHPDFDGVCSSEIWVLSSNKQSCYVDYLFFLIQSEAFIRAASASTGTKMPRADWSVVSKSLFPLPPLPEQRRIAEILSTWDRAIDLAAQLLAAKQQRKRGLMQELLTGKRRFAEFEGEDLAPQRLGDIADVDARSLNDKTDPNYTFKYISLSDVKQGVISSTLETFKFLQAPVRARKLVNDKDILMSTVRPNLQGFGMIHSNASEYVASTGFAVISAKEGYSPEYISQYLFSGHKTAQLNALVVGSNYPAINSTDVRNLLIYSPSLAEQRRIAAVLAACDREIEVLQHKRDLLQQQKQGLMQQVLTGQRRV